MKCGQVLGSKSKLVTCNESAEPSELLSLPREPNTHPLQQNCCFFYPVAAGGGPCPVSHRVATQELPFSNHRLLFCPLPSHPPSFFGQLFSPAPLPALNNSQQIHQNKSKPHITTNRGQNQQLSFFYLGSFWLQHNLWVQGSHLPSLALQVSKIHTDTWTHSRTDLHSKPFCFLQGKFRFCPSA